MARDAHGCIATDCGVALVQALGIHCGENEHASMLPGVWLNAGFVWSCVHLHLSFLPFRSRLPGSSRFIAGVGRKLLWIFSLSSRVPVEATWQSIPDWLGTRYRCL